MRIGVDLGGTKIEAIALADNGAILWRQRRPTPRENYAAIIEVVAELVGELEATLGGTAPVGVATPGSVAANTGALRNCNTTCLNGRFFREDLAARLDRQVRIANDANCFALSEASDGAAAGAAAVFGVILGTGVGGGLVVNGRLLVGANAIAGEWGHNPLPPVAGERRPARPCYCGRRDCIETWLSGPGFEASWREAGGEPLAAPEIAARALDGRDPRAVAVLDRYMADLARALAAVVNIVDPDVIVLGGGMANIATLYDAVPGRWGPAVFSDHIVTRVVPARYGDSSGVRGAAWLWPAAEG